VREREGEIEEIIIRQNSNKCKRRARRRATRTSAQHEGRNKHVRTRVVSVWVKINTQVCASLLCVRVDVCAFFAIVLSWCSILLALHTHTYALTLWWWGGGGGGRGWWWSLLYDVCKCQTWTEVDGDREWHLKDSHTIWTHTHTYQFWLVTGNVQAKQQSNKFPTFLCGKKWKPRGWVVVQVLHMNVCYMLVVN